MLQEVNTPSGREYVENAFASYASRYNPDDPKIKLKIDHTFRVAELAGKIALSTDNADAELAWLSGMLHDIGRFEQVRRFGTFSDADSVDHACLGADLLFKEGMLEDFCHPDKKQKKILELSIRSHSLYRLPEGLSPAERMYCDILRDADKIDIFRVNYETPLEDIYNISTRELKTSEVSQEVKQCFLEGHTVLRSLKKTPADFLVGHICLVFELVYPISRRIAKEQGYVEKLMSFESENERTNEWFEYMRGSLWNRVG